MATVTDNVTQETSGGQFNAGAAAATPTLVYTGSGRLCKINVLTSGSAASDFYDALTATGTPVFKLIASPTIGVSYDVQIPFSTGLYIGGATNSSSVSLQYNKNGINGTAPNVV